MTGGALWLNGTLYDEAPPLSRDRGLLLGDGLFETVLVRRGSPILLSDHLDRLRRSAAALSFPPLPALEDRLGRALEDLFASAEEPGSTPLMAFRVTLTRGPSPRGLAPPTTQKASLFAQLDPYDPAAASAESAAVIEDTEDPTGRKFRVHTGPPVLSVALLAEETTADGVLGDPASKAPALTNPVEADGESLARGEELYVGKCARCHGADGNGTGPSTHGINADPRKLWVWGSAGDAADGYLFSIISNGRTDMPPWGLVLSETERWDLVNYVKTLKAPQ